MKQDAGLGRPRPILLQPRDWGRPSYASVVDALEAAQWGLDTLGVHYRSIHLTKPYDVALARIQQLTRIGPATSADVFLPLMGPKFAQLRMASVIGTPVVLAWDVWEPAVEEWVIELRRARAKAIAVTSSQAADTLRSRLEIPVIHIPEAVNFARLAGGRDLASRPPQVVNFGRRYETWHAAAGRSLEPEIRYLVEEQRGALIARDQQSFASALATSRVSVCFTRSTTDERVAGSFHTMTQRYLESIFAGCIVLGDSPAELQELFGYDPVVNVDWADPLTQVRTLVKNAEKYQGLVDMNTKKVIEVGGWLKRAAQLSGLLAK